ncbi:MAG: hypothetical protein C0462_02080 [Alcanivorax sp.]|nr:hypothetical protein [Alcanivorax sp.]
MSDLVHIALCCDAKYLPYAATTIASCIDSCAEPEWLHFHLVALDIGNDALDKLRVFVEQKGCKIDFHCPGHDIYADFHTQRYGLAVYHRISLPVYLRGRAEWVIYLDSDVLVVDDIRKLWAEKDIDSDMITGAVIDYSPATERHVKIPREKYFNSGVLLINIRKWLDYKIHEKTIDYLNSNHRALTFVDQCSLNVVHDGCWRRLSPRWNIQGNVYSFWRRERSGPAITEVEIKDAISNPGIVHFIASKKPWKIRCYHPYEFAYRKTLKSTPFYEGALPSLADDIFRGWVTKPFRRLGQMLRMVYVYLLGRRWRRDV